jgi:hypothetical protein
MEIPSSVIEKYNMFIFDIVNIYDIDTIYVFLNNYNIFRDETIQTISQVFNHANGTYRNGSYLIVCIDPDSDDVIYTVDKKWWDSGDWEKEQYVKNKVYRFYPELFNVNDLIKIKRILEDRTPLKYGISKMYKPKTFVRESIVKFDNFDNLEYRKGSKEFGGLLTRLLEYLRLVRKEEKELTFNLQEFEKESNITKKDLESLVKAKEDGKNLFDFDIIIDGNTVTFTSFNSGKTRPFESISAIRTEYEDLGVEDFYKKKGSEYINPHLKDIEESIKEIVDLDIVDLSNVLDLGAGTGEVTNILNELGYYNIEGVDLYLCKEYEKRTGNKCIELSFNDIRNGKLNNKEYSTIICSYALHLADKSILHDLLWELSLISKYLIIISPTKKPEISSDSWEEIYSFTINKSKNRIYTSKNINI